MSEDNSFRTQADGEQAGLIPFQHNFQGLEVRTVSKSGQVWFVAQDVCEILEHSNSRMALQRLEDGEKGVSSLHPRWPAGGRDREREWPLRSRFQLA